MAQLTWSSRRKIKLGLIWLSLGLMGAGIALLLRYVPISFVDPDTLPDVGEQLADSLGPFSVLLSISGVGHVIADYPKLIVAASGFLLLGLPLAAVAGRRLHDVYFASFNDEVLTPIKRQLPIDQSLEAVPFVVFPWCLGTAGARRDAWDQLHRWARKGTGFTSRWRPWRRQLKSLSTATLVGRSGSGKSRMAGEFGRDLARRDRLGTGSKAPLPWRLGTYFRRTVWFLHPRGDDPWDAAILRSRMREESFDQFCARLKAWKPRRPTLLLLDDPGFGQTGKVHQALAEASSRFAHPVRLLVVNQTVTSDSDYRYAQDGWLYGDAPADPAPILLSEKAWFSEQESRAVAFASGLLDGKPESVRRIAREQLFPITKGNPLLVELALEWLTQADSFDGITVERLRKNRVERIVRALKTAGVDKPSQLGQLALATLVGGADRTRLEEEASRDSLFPALEELPLRDQLQSCFPSDPLTWTSARQRIPPVRPDLIADAFVDRIIEQVGVEKAGKLVRAAFRIDAAAMLRKIARPRLPDSPLATAIDELDVSALDDIHPLDWALAHAELAIFIQLDDWLVWTTAIQEERNGRAIAAIASLDAQDRIRFARSLASRAAIAPEDAMAVQLQSHVLLRLIDHATRPGDVHLDAETWIALFTALENHAAEWNAPEEGGFEGLRRSAANVRDNFHVADRLLESAWRVGYYWRQQLVGPLQALAPTGEDVLNRARRCRFNAMVACLTGDTAKIVDEIDALERPVAAEGTNAALALEAARANGYLAYGLAYVCSLAPEPERMAEARQAADKAAGIARAFPDDSAIHVEAAKARGYEAYAWSLVPKGARANEIRTAAETLAEIARRFPADPDIQDLAAGVRYYEAYAWSIVQAGSEADKAQEAADLAAEIARRFPADPAIQFCVTEARGHQAHAWSEVPDGAQADKASCAADQAAEIGRFFPVYPALQCRAARARRCAAFAWSMVPHGAEAAKTREAVEQVSRIALSFPGDFEIQSEAGEARAYEAFAWSEVRDGAEARKAHDAAARIGEIAASFPGNEEMCWKLARALRSEAWAWMAVPAGAQAARARDAGDRIAAIARAFPMNAGIQVELANARRAEAGARSHVPAGAQADSVCRIADAVAEIAALFPEDANVQLQLIGTLAYAAYAWNHVPDGAQAEAARAAADRAAEVALGFPDDRHIQIQVAAARRYEAFAWSEVPAGRQAAMVRKCADRIAEIAGAHRDQKELQIEAARSRCYEAYAWSKVRSTAAKANARRAADKVAALAALYPLDAEMIDERTKAEECARLAALRSPKSGDGP